MLPDMDVLGCQNLAVPMSVMQHVVRVESSFNRYAIGVVGGRLVRQPANLPEALATARELRARGFNFSLGLAQINRYNLRRYGLSLERAFQACPNLQAGARILADCQVRAGKDWGKSLSCYYSGNFVTGFRQGYVQKVFASMRAVAAPTPERFVHVIPIISSRQTAEQIPRPRFTAVATNPRLVSSRISINADLMPARPASANTALPAASVILAASAPQAATSGATQVPGAIPSIRPDEAFVF